MSEIVDAGEAVGDLASEGVERRGWESSTAHAIEGRVFRFSPHVTFTPFASARPCSARCWFCSETLRPVGATVLAASLRPGPAWADGLERALRALRGLPIGYSLSGLESTDDADWLEAVLERLESHGRVSPVGDRVLYSNAAGLAAETTGARLIPRLASFGLTRVEVSRHHDDPDVNTAIMRFRPGQAIADGRVFERTVETLLAAIPVRLVCIIQQGGIASFDDAMRYLAWARARGVRDVVFRELSRVPSGYVATRSLRLVSERRVAIEPLVEAARSRLAPAGGTDGYYYWNRRFVWGDLTVTFETSDYETMKERHRSDVVHKLVFHGNGRLCADWDPETRILLDTSLPG
jgi:hypothetical protein